MSYSQRQQKAVAISNKFAGISVHSALPGVIGSEKKKDYCPGWHKRPDKRPEVRKNGSRVLRTQEDWNEWRANTLGAAILMPQSEVDRAMWFINSRKPLTCYGWRFYDSDQVKIDTFCGVFGVSRSAAAIRLEQLGYLNRKKDYEYRDPLEVWP